MNLALTVPSSRLHCSKILALWCDLLLVEADTIIAADYVWFWEYKASQNPGFQVVLFGLHLPIVPIFSIAKEWRVFLKYLEDGSAVVWAGVHDSRWHYQSYAHATQAGWGHFKMMEIVIQFSSFFQELSASSTFKMSIYLRCRYSVCYNSYPYEGKETNMCRKIRASASQFELLQGHEFWSWKFFMRWFTSKGQLAMYISAWNGNSGLTAKLKSITCAP